MRDSRQSSVSETHAHDSRQVTRFDSLAVGDRAVSSHLVDLVGGGRVSAAAGDAAASASVSRAHVED
eukprot:scaffold4518_cov129-Isochrysis_galbana.AAC.6